MSSNNSHGPGIAAWASAFVVAGAAAALSFSALADLARISGVADLLAPLLPITIDAGILVAAKFWLTEGLSDRVTKFARTITLALIAVSSLGNIAGHAFAEAAPTRLWLTALVSLVAPLTLAGLAHLMVIARMDNRVPPFRVITCPEPPTIPIPMPYSGPVLAAVGSDQQTEGKDTEQAENDDLVEQLRRWVEQEGKMPSKRRVIAELRVGHARATELMDAVGGAA